MYFVFRRNDGYVHAMNSTRRPDDPNLTILLETDVWNEALDLIVNERARPDYPEFEWSGRTWG